MFEMFFYLLHIMNAAIEKAKVDLLTDHDTFIKGITYRQGYSTAEQNRNDNMFFRTKAVHENLQFCRHIDLVHTHAIIVKPAFNKLTRQ